jgi:hypothetical protein
LHAQHDCVHLTADITMSELEVIALLLGLLVAGIGVGATTHAGLHRISRARNPGLGLIRLAVLVSMIWIAFVIRYYADPSVKGIYTFFYLVLGYAVVKVFGQLGAAMYGFGTRIDAGERRNFGAAIMIAGFTLSTGMIFGGSLWGEADPIAGNDEGGFWIPLGFFSMGWVILAISVRVYLHRASKTFRDLIVRERRTAEAWGAFSFMFSTAWLLTSAVSGDFFGWVSGIKDVALAAGLLVIHELLQPPANKPELAPIYRTVAGVIYFVVAGVNWVLPWLMSAGML